MGMRNKKDWENIEHKRISPCYSISDSIEKHLYKDQGSENFHNFSLYNFTECLAY